LKYLPALSVDCEKRRFKKNISIGPVDRSVSLKLLYPGAEPGLFNGGAGTMGSHNQWGMFLTFSQTFLEFDNWNLIENHSHQKLQGGTYRESLISYKSR